MHPQVLTPLFYFTHDNIKLNSSNLFIEVKEQDEVLQHLLERDEDGYVICNFGE